MINTQNIIITLVLCIAGAFYWYNSDDQGSVEDQYEFFTVDRSNIVQTISANGTLTPVVLVNVGTQVSGTVYKLHVDFNDQVVKGQILAELDPSLLNAQLQQSEASLLSAKAAFKLAKSKLERNIMLVNKGFVSDETLDVLEQELDASRAQLAASDAQAARDRVNLNYSIIKSPISGVIIARDIDLGQTVAANFQTPTLFQIANSLDQMQINISVAEADIGQLFIGQTINFTVDAFQQREFVGTVKQVRLNPVIEENVVTYNVIAMVNNKDKELLPGMTANVRFIVSQRDDVLRVRNAALRFKPKNMDKSDKAKAPPQRTSKQPKVYLLKQDKPEPVNVSTGITDGGFTEITGGDIKVDDRVIIREMADPKESKSKFRFRVR